MQRKLSWFAVSLVGVLCATQLAAAENEKKKGKGKGKGRTPIVLFDGNNLEAWDFHLVDPNVKLEDVWSIQEGALVCKGEPLGYLVTRQEFQNFRLTLEWRWPSGKEPGNSGVLLRATGEPIGFMPKCVEAQLKHGSAGDIWGFRGFNVDGPKERFRQVKDHAELGNFNGVGASKNAEKEAGQWNQYEIVLKGDTMIVSVNGEVVNEATGCDVVAGKIGLQSEGGEIHFRNIRITRLGEGPAKP